MNDGRIIPVPDGPNVEFYRHAVSGTLHLQRCPSCGRFQHPPRYRCPACGDALEWVPLPGAGRIHSWTVTHRPVDPGWADRIPYATVVVELDEGPRLVGGWENAEPTDLGLDLPVTLRIEPAGDEFAFLWFSPRH